MPRFLALKLISKNSTNFSASYFTNNLGFLPKPNPIHSQNVNESLLSRITTALSHSGPKPQKIFGGFWNPVIVKQFLPKANVFLKTPGKSIVDSKLLFFGNSIRSSNYNSSYTSYSTARRWFQRLDSDQVVLGLIISNVAVFLLWRVADLTFMRENFMISVDNFRSGRVHTLITSAFSHTEVGHLVTNMIGLYFFGTGIGRTFGPGFVLKLYLSGALAGSVFYLVYHAFLNPSKSIMSPYVRGLGASGAVNAIMLLDIFLRPTATLLFDFIIPVPAILLGIYIIGQDILRMIEGDTQISGSAHMGGAVVAAIAWARYRKRRFY